MNPSGQAKGQRRRLSGPELDALLAAADAELLDDVRRTRDHTHLHRAILASRRAEPDISLRHMPAGSPASAVMLRLEAWRMLSEFPEAVESADDAVFHMRRLLASKASAGSPFRKPAGGGDGALARHLGGVLFHLGRLLTHLVNVEGLAASLGLHARASSACLDPHDNVRRMRASVAPLLESGACAEILTQPFTVFPPPVGLDREADRFVGLLGGLPWDNLPEMVRSTMRELTRVQAGLREVRIDACGADLSRIASREPEFFAGVVWSDDTVWAPGMSEIARAWSGPVAPGIYQVMPVGPHKSAPPVPV